MPHEPWHQPDPRHQQILGRVGWPGTQPQGLLGHGEAGGFANPDWTRSSPAFNKYNAPKPDEFIPEGQNWTPIHPTDPERDPAKYDWEEMTMSDGTTQLVEPLREKEPGRQFNWGALNTLGAGGVIPGVEAPTLNLGFGGGSGGVDQIIARNAAVDWEEFQRRQQQGMGVYGGPNV